MKRHDIRALGSSRSGYRVPHYGLHKTHGGSTSRGTGLPGDGWSKNARGYEKREGGKRGYVSQDKDGTWSVAVNTSEKKLLDEKGLTQTEALQRAEKTFSPPATDVEWAKGVRAARDLGGQVPQKAVKEADKILQKASLIPTTRKAPKTYKDIGKFYEKTRPVSGDTWKTKGITIEVGKITRSGTGGSAIDIHIRTSKEGRTSTVYTSKDWTNE